MTANRYWRVSFFPDGRVNRVRPIKGPGHSRWVVVEAADEEQAKHKAYNIYCARKKKARLAALAAESRCSCGRPLDGALVGTGARKGQAHRRCATCRERAKTSWVPNYNRRVESGTNGRGVVERDESARVASNLNRQRDRRAEIRLETLIDVRRAWQDAPNNGAFTAWLKSEIETLAKGAAA
jgi:hypothetical protein